MREGGRGGGGGCEGGPEEGGGGGVGGGRRTGRGQARKRPAEGQMSGAYPAKLSSIKTRWMSSSMMVVHCGDLGKPVLPLDRSGDQPRQVTRKKPPNHRWLRPYRIPRPHTTTQVTRLAAQAYQVASRASKLKFLSAQRMRGERGADKHGRDRPRVRCLVRIPPNCRQ